MNAERFPNDRHHKTRTITGKSNYRLIAVSPMQRAHLLILSYVPRHAGPAKHPPGNIETGAMERRRIGGEALIHSMEFSGAVDMLDIASHPVQRSSRSWHSFAAPTHLLP
jgi:hypothetical protein